MNRQQLLEQRAQLLQRMEALNAQTTWAEAQQTEWDQIDAEMRSVDAALARLDTLEQRQAQVNTSTGRQVIVSPLGDPLTRGGVTPPPPAEDEQPQCNYRNFGEFLCDVRFHPGADSLRAFTFESGSGLGFLIPHQFSQQILQVNPESVIVRPRATVIPAGEAPDAEITFPAFQQGAEGAYGGVSVTWTGEGQQPTEQSAELKEITAKPSEATADVVVTNKLLRNTTAAATFITTLLRNALAGNEDYKFLRGSGVGCPSGLLTSPGVINVARVGAGAFAFADATTMLSKLNPDSMGQALWIINQSVMQDLLEMKDGANRLVFIAGDVTKGIPATLFGIPVRFTGRTPVVGVRGDVILADLSMYLIKDGSGPAISTSEHVFFRTNKTVIKIVRSVDGMCWQQAPLTLEDGATQVSCCVALQ